MNSNLKLPLFRHSNLQLYLKLPMSDSDEERSGSGAEEDVVKEIPLVETKSALKEGEFYPEDWVLSHQEDCPIERKYLKFR